MRTDCRHCTLVLTSSFFLKSLCLLTFFLLVFLLLTLSILPCPFSLFPFYSSSSLSPFLPPTTHLSLSLPIICLKQWYLSIYLFDFYLSINLSIYFQQTAHLFYVYVRSRMITVRKKYYNFIHFLGLYLHNIIYGRAPKWLNCLWMEMKHS